MTVIHNNAWKSLLFSHIKIHPHICLEVFWTDFTSERSLICGYFSLDSDEMTFSLEKAILWIEDSHFSQKQRFKVKRVLMMDLFITNIWSFSLHMMLIDGLEWCGLLWFFLSAIWTLILMAPIHCRGSIGEHATFLQIWWRNKLLYISDLSKSSANFHFWMNYSFKK